MSDPKPLIAFEHPPCLQEYMISEKEFFQQNPQYTHLVTGAVVFNSEGNILLVQRAADEKAFPNLWEIPGGKVDSTDETILHAAARELKEETGLDTSRIVRKVGEFSWSEVSKKTGFQQHWQKLIFEMEVKDMKIVLDPNEHQEYLFATEEDVLKGKSADVALSYITPANKTIKLEAFKFRRQTIQS
ncbi:uncharacterized protein BDR25DRAFT_331499 [Lindgomyces ingoldianus]|uniref:Uncharacterized protein n=1 Tax=Lindgomyces ingoldianus TaxID=673940 RepID=A0ACB6R977_9PLEO|nr:uncharacterized protein BDR25DRAFT_331499 [Lindgomyces ingoldianus]KAF2475706.1 hypothetical protein BDR25DRAFT_331499 [Lindgomyces ingoldianus]